MAANVDSFFNKFFSFLLLLLLHLGCFFFASSSTAATSDGHRKVKPPAVKRRNKLLAASSSSAVAHSRFKANKALSSSWAYIKRAFFTPKVSATPGQASPSPTTLTSARSSHRSLVSMVQPESITLDPAEPPHSQLPAHVLLPPALDSDITSDHSPLFLPLRNDIFPCTACGEIFCKPHLLEQHLSIKHAVSELTGDDSGQNIVKIIFKTGWTNRDLCPRIHRVLKIHNSPKMLARFEEYRELVKSKAARNGAAGRRRDERCIADGNELLRFHCTTFMCDLGQDGNSATCNQQYCSVCGVIRSGFSPKLDGISTLSTSWRAHAAIPEETLEEFRFMNVRRGMLICRVIAGRVGCDPEDEDIIGVVAGKGEDAGFDSVVGRGGSGALTRLDEEELLVYSPRAVLPCFVIVYTV